MKKLLSTLLACFCLASAFGQSLQVTGKVTDAKDKSPMPGVTIRTQGNIGTMTDTDGAFSIKAEKGSTLTFSFLGMGSKTITVESESPIHISMEEEDHLLDDVIVIGYGTVKKRDLSGAVSQIKADDILKGNPSSSINQALQGRIAGVTVSQNDGAPGAGISISIRGTNSFATSSQPLYIVDGIPYDPGSAPKGALQQDNNQTSNALANINPHDIESIDVLKDASATAIYGSRGANGVVIITTKRGKSGEDRIEFSSNFSVANATKKMKLLDPVTYAQYVNEGVINRATYEGTPYHELPYEGKWKYQYDTNDNIITNTGKYNPSPTDFLNPGVYTDEYGNKTSIGSTDWQDEIFQTSFTQEYNLSVSGGNDKGWHSFSGNFLDQTGIIYNSSYKRYALRANIGRKVRSWLEMGTNISYTNGVTEFTKSNSADAAVIRSALMFPPTYDPSVGREESNELNWLAANPYVYVRHAKDQLRTNNVFSSSYVLLKFTDYLNFRQNIGISYSNGNRYAYYDKLTQEGYESNGRGAQDDNWYQGLTSESILTFDKTFNKVHNLNIVGGFTLEDSQWGSKGMAAKDFPTDVTGPYNLGIGLLQEKLTTDRGTSRLVSLLGRANYSYQGKYILTASVRRDGSSRFVEGNKFVTFPSAAVAWRISDEEFIKNISYIHSLKARFSYGKTGNQGINPYQTRAALKPSNYLSNGSLSPGLAEEEWRGALNPDLKWETTDQYNIGLDMSFLGGKIDFVVDYYQKKTTDLLQNVAIETNSGFKTMWKNYGWVKNQGLEITGNFHPIDIPDFSWDISANISFNKNEIGGLNGDQYANRLWHAADQVFIQRNGLPIGAIYGFVEDGFYDNVAEVRAFPQYANTDLYSDQTVKSMVGEVKYRDLDGDGTITDKDRTVIGDTNPDFTFGLTNSFKWKDFNFSFFLQGSVGNDVFNANLMDVKMGNIANIPQYVYDSRWTEDNKAGARWPKAISGGYGRTWKISDRYVEDGSYLRLKNINVGYTIKPKIKEIQSINIFFSASNLFTITGYDWFDPDVNAFGSESSQKGVDLYSYPSSRTFSLGLKLEF